MTILYIYISLHFNNTTVLKFNASVIRWYKFEPKDWNKLDPCIKNSESIRISLENILIKPSLKCKTPFTIDSKVKLSWWPEV